MPAIVFMAGFAAFWWLAGLMGAQLPLPVFAVGPIVSAVLIFAAAQRFKGAPPRDAGQVKRTRRIVSLAAGGEGLLISIAANLMIHNGLAGFVLPAVAIIVGLHFVPLAMLLKVRIYYLTAVLITAAGLAALAIDPNHRALVTGLPVAMLLWLTCAFRIAAGRPRSDRAA
jgi:hypothetical protein